MVQQISAACLQQGEILPCIRLRQRSSRDDLRAAADTLNDAGDSLKDAMDILQDAETVLEDAIDAFQWAGDAMNEAFDLLDKATEDLHTMVKTLAEEPTISFPPIGSDITAKGDELDDAVSDIIDNAKKLTDVVSGSADNILADLTTISDQVQSITDLLRQETQDAKDEADKNLVEDISDQIDSDQQRTGCVSSRKRRNCAKWLCSRVISSVTSDLSA